MDTSPIAGHTYQATATATAFAFAFAFAFANHYAFAQGGYDLPVYPFFTPPESGGKIIVRHPIVIIGAGITGLAMACTLARQGIAALAINEDHSVGIKSASSRGIYCAQNPLEFPRAGPSTIGAWPTACSGVSVATFAGKHGNYSFDLSTRAGCSCRPILPSSTSSSSTSTIFRSSCSTPG